ncbi:MAG: TRAP transporter permease [Proteobacteria bacterium]|nr:TRAP transporter permease [Pseudomonadota bacterium]MDA1357486.1 TRAP transporter permease [Pseudomonadota bacterium]
MAKPGHKNGEPPGPEAKSGEAAAQDILEQVESGPRSPDLPIARIAILLLCIVWSGYQLYIAYQPVNATIARAWHLAFAILLVYLAYPAYNESRLPFWVKLTRKIFPRARPRRSLRSRIPPLDIALGVTAAAAALYIWWDYEGIITRQGLPSTADVWVGVVMIVLLLEAARRALGLALPILGMIFLAYSFLGPYMPEFLRHRGIPLDYVIADQFLSTTGIFGVPLGVSTDFVFLFVLFGALLDRAGAGKYFIDVAFAGLGWMRGGPAKAAVVASGLTGMVSGSSIANTVTTGTFTIPLMKKVGLPAYKAAAIEVASSTNGQLMPPIMGAAAFIMAEIIGIPYLDVVRAALIPALVSYIALFYVVHLEARKLDIKPIPRSELPRLLKTFLGGLHYLLPIIVLVVYLVVLRRSAITSALFAIEALAVIIVVQRPIIAWLAWWRAGHEPAPGQTLGLALRTAFVDGIKDIFLGLIGGARNMIAVGVATASAGIIVGVVTSTGLVGRFVTLIDTVSMGNIYLMLILTAITSMILGMGLPTTANYIVMATLTAPVIVTLGSDAGLIFPLIAAHLFVFYFGILADDTPPVGLAAYAAAAIARSDPIRTGVQGFTYDLRTAILPFIFLFNTDLLMIDGVAADGAIVWIDDPLRLIWIFVVTLLAMFAFAAAIQGFFAERCSIIERVILLGLCVLLFRPTVVAEPLGIPREAMQALALCGCALLYAQQRLRAGSWRLPGRSRPTDK